jgi:hypothetical protein
MISSFKIPRTEKKIEKVIIKIGDFNNPLKIIDRTNRKSEKIKNLE